MATPGVTPSLSASAAKRVADSLKKHQERMEKAKALRLPAKPTRRRAPSSSPATSPVASLRLPGPEFEDTIPSTNTVTVTTPPSPPPSRPISVVRQPSNLPLPPAASLHVKPIREQDIITTGIPLFGDTWTYLHRAVHRVPTVLKPSIRQAIPNPTVRLPKTVIWSPSVRQIEQVLADSPRIGYDSDHGTFGRSCAFCHHNRQSGSWLPDLSILEQDSFQDLPDEVQEKFMDEAFKEAWFDLNCEDHGGDAMDLD